MPLRIYSEATVCIEQSLLPDKQVLDSFVKKPVEWDLL